MHARFRFFDGLGEDTLGYIFPRGNAVGIPTSTNLNPDDRDRFGCGHSDDSEAASADTADIAGRALVRVLDTQGRPETIVHGRYVLPDGTLSRDPLGGPVLNCTTKLTYTAASHPARSVRLVGGRRVTPTFWMSLSGLPQRLPDRYTRGYFERQRAQGVVGRLSVSRRAGAVGAAGALALADAPVSPRIPRAGQRPPVPHRPAVGTITARGGQAVLERAWSYTRDAVRPACRRSCTGAAASSRSGPPVATCSAGPQPGASS